MITRRRFLTGVGAGLLAGCVPAYEDERISNPCPPGPLPQTLAADPVLATAWQGIGADRVWDCHVHVAGFGDAESGIWINPQLRSWLAPLRRLRTKFYLDAACVDPAGVVDTQYVARLLALHGDFPRVTKLMLLALDYHYREDGERDLSRTTFAVPNEYAALLAQTYPQSFLWTASVHPYRKDCVQALARCAAGGARAVKWLPPAMGMDPSSPLCDPFYDALVKLQLPLLTHGGHEYAVAGSELQALGNPLLLRRALDHGVRVLVAHCASLGSSVDLDKGKYAAKQSNFSLFSRLMAEARYEGRLFGEISATLLINHDLQVLDELLRRDEWHARLINGSDYPLPGIMPLYSLRRLVARGLLDEAKAHFCAQLRVHNPLLADFVIKRHLAKDGRRFAASVFESARVMSPVVA